MWRKELVELAAFVLCTAPRVGQGQERLASKDPFIWPRWWGTLTLQLQPFKGWDCYLTSSRNQFLNDRRCIWQLRHHCGLPMSNPTYDFAEPSLLWKYEYTDYTLRHSMSSRGPRSLNRPRESANGRESESERLSHTSRDRLGLPPPECYNKAALTQPPHIE